MAEPQPERQQRMQQAGPLEARQERETVLTGPWGQAMTMTKTAVPVTHISWSSIFAGLVIAIVAQIILSAIGGVIGLTVGTSRAVSIGLGAWTGFSSLISLFLGAWISSRMAALGGAGTGILHGVLVWGLFFISAVILASVGAAAALGILTPNLLVNPGQVAVVTGYALLGMALSLFATILGGLLGGRGRENEIRSLH